VQTGTFDISGIDIRSDITSIPLPEASIDNILCTEVLEHVLDPVLAIRALTRLLRSKGRLLITVPGTSLLHFSPYHYFTGFKYHFFDKILPEQGIEVKSIVRVGSIYTVAALYLWFIADKIAKVIFPWKHGLFHRFLLILLLPFFAVLFILNKIPACSLESLEAGLLVIGRKKE
jgi:SAM-dependent methyltransferase